MLDNQHINTKWNVQNIHIRIKEAAILIILMSLTTINGNGRETKALFWRDIKGQFLIHPKLQKTDTLSLWNPIYFFTRFPRSINLFVFYGIHLCP